VLAFDALGNVAVASMAADHCGNFFVGGFTGGALVAGQANAGGEDMFVMRVDF
jgi:hypothetical protein